jgi:hypothetical protein
VITASIKTGARKVYEHHVEVLLRQVRSMGGDGFDIPPSFKISSRDEDAILIDYF